MDSYTYGTMAAKNQTTLRRDTLAAAQKVKKAFIALETFKNDVEFDRFFREPDGKVKIFTGDTATGKKGDQMIKGTPDFIIKNYGFYHSHLKSLVENLENPKSKFVIVYQPRGPGGLMLGLTEGGKGTPAWTPEGAFTGWIGNVTISDLYFANPNAETRADLIVHEWGRKYVDLPQEATGNGTVKDVHRWNGVVRYLFDLHESKNKKK